MGPHLKFDSAPFIAILSSCPPSQMKVWSPSPPNKDSVTPLRVRRLGIIFVQPNLHACRARVVFTLTNCTIAHRREWCRERAMFPLTGVLTSGDDEMNSMPTSSCHFITDLAGDRLWCGKEGSMCSTTGTTY